MGCLCSGGQAAQALTYNLDRLDELEETVQSSRSSGVLNVAEFDRLIAELHTIHNFLQARSHSTTRTAALASSVSAAINASLDKAVLQKSDSSSTIQALRSLAESVDGVKQGAIYSFNAKLREVSNQLAEETIVAAEAAVNNLADPAALAKDASAFVRIISDGEIWLSDMDTLKPRCLEVLKNFKAKFMQSLRDAIGTSPSQFSELRRAAEHLDRVAFKILPGLGWQSLSPEVNDLVARQALAFAPTFLEVVRGEMDKKPIDIPSTLAAIRRFGEIAASLSKPEQTLVTGFIEVCERFEATLSTRWDTALEAEKGKDDTTQTRKVEGWCREYEECLKVSAALGTAYAERRGTVLMQKIDEHHGQTEANKLTKCIQGAIREKEEVLNRMHRDVKNNLSAMSREQLEQMRPPTWSFKLRSGGWKKFARDSNTDVEKAYQRWIAAGKPAGQTSERRTQLVIDIPPATPGGSMRTTGTGSGSLGAAGDRSRSDPNPGAALAASQERYSIDFMLLTQLSLTKGGLRRIKRELEGTEAEQLTNPYFAEVSQLFRDIVGYLEEVEARMRLLGNSAHGIQNSIDGQLRHLASVASDFLEVAVLVRDTKAMNDFMSLLPMAYIEKMGIESRLKELRLKDVMNEIRYWHKDVVLAGSYALPKKWEGVRLLMKNHLLLARLKLNDTKLEIQVKSRRRAMMLGQALLNEYKDKDDEFCSKLRSEAGRILSASATSALERRQIEELCAILRGLKSFECEMSEIYSQAQDWIRQSLIEACDDELMSVLGIVERLEDNRKISKVGLHATTEQDVVKELLSTIIDRCVKEATLQVKYIQLFLQLKVGSPKRALAATAGVPEMIARSVLQVATLRSKLGDAVVDFDKQFFETLQPKYEQLRVEEKEATVEWSVAYCEQLGLDVPDWMMNKDEVAALRRLQSGVDTENVDVLVEALTLAKRTKTSDPQFVDLSNVAMETLRRLKKLPPGWEVQKMLLDDKAAKLQFAQAEMGSESIKSLFQKLLDGTNVGILTRDRVALQGTDAVPRGYKVQRVVSVMNPDSWGLYVARREEISRHKSTMAKPDSDATEMSDIWKRSELPATLEYGQDILRECNLPPLDIQNSNECLMLHGTKPEAANSIAQNHFDMAFACKDGLFGAGLYFAESSSKSDEYVKGDKGGQFPVIVARVALGHINYCDKPDPTVDPGRDKLLDSCVSGEFHSVLGDRKKVRNTYREFIVYDHYQVYPQFIVWYTRL